MSLLYLPLVRPVPNPAEVPCLGWLGRGGDFSRGAMPRDHTTDIRATNGRVFRVLVSRSIGEGAFGTVRRATMLPRDGSDSEVTCAAKQQRIGEPPEGQPLEFLRSEAAMHEAVCPHDSIARYIGVAEGASDHWIFMELGEAASCLID